MATIASSTVVIPSFTGLKSATCATKPATVKLVSPTTATPRLVVKSSLKSIGAAVIATAAAGILAGNAMAAEVKMGADDGSLVFVPKEFSVASGEIIVFKNNAGFPHNVVFDEDAVPSGVDVAKISMNDEELLNAPGEEFKVTLIEKGTYTFYCNPHQGSGMVGQVTVN